MSVNQLANSTVGIIANGTTNASTAICPPNSFYNQILTSTTTNYAIVLPNAPIIGQEYKYRNDGAYFALFFPGTGVSTINGAASFCMSNAGCQATFVCTSLTLPGVATWFTMNTSGTGAISVAAATSMLACNTYKTNILVSQAAAYIITLPTPVGNVNCQYKCIITTAGANQVQVTAGAGLLCGVGMNTPGVAATCVMINNAAATNYNFVATSVVGDNVELVSNGLLYCTVGMSGGAAKSTFT